MCIHIHFYFEAEAGGFEPPVRLPVRQFSKLVVSATHPNFLPLRFLADSNRRTRFCRPLTKPLIQGTKNTLQRVVSRLRMQRYNYFLNYQTFGLLFPQKSAFLFFSSQPLHPSHGLLEWFIRLKYWMIARIVKYRQTITMIPTIISCMYTFYYATIQLPIWFTKNATIHASTVV